MNLYEIGRTLWRERLAALSCAVLAVVVAVVATFHISISPVSVHPRALQMGAAGSSVLVDTERSSLGDAHTNPKRYATLTMALTELVNTRPVIAPVARALHVAPNNVGVQVQVTDLVPLVQSKPLEPQVGTEILATRRHYYLVARNDTGTQEIQLYAQAPTAREAYVMVTTAARALGDYVAGSVRAGKVSPSHAIVIRQLGVPYARELDSNVTWDAAILVAIVVWVLAMAAVLTIKAQARRAATERPTPAATQA